jgi:hypothetical protein
MCILKVSSETESFKRFAAESTSLPVLSVWDKGDIRHQATGRRYPGNRISFDVSKCDWDDLAGQICDAIAFLGQHGAELRRLLASHNVSLAFLDFPIWSRLDEVANQSDYLPVDLLRLCGEIGIGITISTYLRESAPENAQ